MKQAPLSKEFQELALRYQWPENLLHLAEMLTTDIFPLSKYREFFDLLETEHRFMRNFLVLHIRNFLKEKVYEGNQKAIGHFEKLFPERRGPSDSECK